VALDEETRRENWAAQAEEDLGHVVPNSYFPVWLSGPMWTLIAWGATALQPPLAHPAAAACLAVAAIAVGIAARRLPGPTLVRYWSALVAALAGFVVALLLTLNTDSLLLTVWATSLGCLGGFTIVMVARRDILTAPRAH
jgi:hypothetical protein